MANNEKPSKRFTFAKSFMSGGISAVISKTILAPIERIKLLLQNQWASVQIEKGNQYRGITDCFRRVVAEQGFFSLWRGYLVTIGRYFPVQACNFSFNNYYKKFFVRYTREESPFKFLAGNILSGSWAGITSVSLLYPLDVIRTRLGVDVGKDKAHRQFNNSIDVVVKLVKSDGIHGIYRGIGISLVLTTFYRGTYFGLFDTGKAWLFPEGRKSNFALIWLFTLCTTTVGNSWFYPLDTIRRRLMMQSGRSDVFYEGTIDWIKKIYRTEGGRAFFKGVIPNVMKGIGGSLVLTLNEKIKRLL